MLLNSYSFLLIFLPVVVVLYWVIPRGYARLLFLIAASLLFYGLWDWRYVPLLLGTTLVDWAAGEALTRMQGPRRRKLLLAGAIAVNLALLAYFKYRGFFFAQTNGLLKLLGAGEPLPALRVFLPIGISFYTFAGISYAVDVYRGMIKPAKSVIHYLAWVTLFPYILAGPIIRVCPSNQVAVVGQGVPVLPGAQVEFINEGLKTFNCGWNTIADSGSNNPLEILELL